MNNEIIFIVCVLSFFSFLLIMPGLKDTYLRKEIKNRFLLIKGGKPESYNLLNPMVFFERFMKIPDYYYDNSDKMLLTLLLKYYKLNVYKRMAKRYLLIAFLFFCTSVLYTLNESMLLGFTILLVSYMLLMLKDLISIFSRKNINWKKQILLCILFPFFYSKYLSGYYEKDKGGYDLRKKLKS